MNTPVSFDIAKLLKEKGFDERLNYYYDSFGDIGSSKVKVNWNESEELLCSAPTIAEVVMWLYEKHGIWTVVNVNIMGSWYFEHFDLKEKRNAQFKPTDTHYDSSTEAYSQAILYTLKNLI